MRRLSLLPLLVGCASVSGPLADAGPSCQPLAETESVALTEDEAEALAVGGMGVVQQRVEYPEFARRAGIQGVVVVAFVVGRDGRVLCTDVVEPVDPMLDASARRAVAASAFQPHRVEGRPGPFASTVEVAFRLR